MQQFRINQKYHLEYDFICEIVLIRIVSLNGSNEPLHITYNKEKIKA